MVIRYRIEEIHHPPTPITFCDADYTNFEIGDVIKSYSFKPDEERTLMFKIGTIIEKGYVNPVIPHLEFYSIVDDRDKTWYIRLSLDRWLEFDDRITKLEKNDVKDL